MSGKTPIIAIVGRTNVGKSTLFNYICGRRMAIVENTPGITRDRSYAYVTKHSRPFTLIDTGGLVGEEGEVFATSVREQGEIAIAEADAIIAVFDGLAGLHPQDSEVVDLLRRSEKPVFWVLNKCEKPSRELTTGDFYSMGIDHIDCISATQDIGVKELLGKVLGWFKDNDIKGSGKQSDRDNSIRIAILGKPNAGKSTLVNRLIGEDRLVTSDIPGTTRDSIEIDFKREDQNFTLIDTAGLRKKKKIKHQSVERYSNLRALRALAECDVAILMIDATLGAPTDQDAKIAELIHERGRSVVVVVNKWDAIEKDHKTVKEYGEMVFDVLRFIKYAPILFISAESGKRCPLIFKKAAEVHKAAQERIPTSDLNRLFIQAVEKHPPPVHKGKAVKIYFVTQVETSPPSFVIFVNFARGISTSYVRYLKNCIRKKYPFAGTDIRITVRKRTSKKMEER